MSSINKATVIGHVGSDPEVRKTNSGTSVANFSVATQEPGKGDQKPPTEWHHITVFGDTVDKFVGPYVHKGDLVYVEGRIHYSKYEKGGQTVNKAEIVAFSVKKLNPKNGATSESAAPAATTSGEAETEEVPF